MSRRLTGGRSWEGFKAVLATPLVFVAWPVAAAIADPTAVLLLTLAVLVFSPPDLPGPPFDRIMLALLVLCTGMNALYSRWRVKLGDPVVVTYGALAAIATLSVLRQPFDVQTYGLLAAKYVVPTAMFVISAQVFGRASSEAYFFRFTNLLLLYLVVIAIAFLVGAEVLIVPRFILDTSIGIMTDRARGPFLQAEANGTAITLLALLGWYWWEKNRLKGGVILAVVVGAVCLAIVATLTRAVWLSFAISLLLVVVSTTKGRKRRVAIGALVLILTVVVALTVASPWSALLSERASEAGPVEFRMAAYRAGLHMFREHPLLGVGFNQSPMRLANYIVGYDFPTGFVVHNTYLDVLLEQGLVGLFLYLITFVFLWRIGARLPEGHGSPGRALLDRSFVPIWRIMLIVFLTNGFFVVMSYQSINALLFTVAGIIRAREREAVLAGRNNAWGAADASLATPELRHSSVFSHRYAGR